MKKCNRKIGLALFLSTALIWSVAKFVCAQEADKTAATSTLPRTKVFELAPGDVTAMIASRSDRWLRRTRRPIWSTSLPWTTHWSAKSRSTATMGFHVVLRS